MKKFLIERHIPGVGGLDTETYRSVAQRSNDALAQLGPDNIQWERSIVTADQTYCIYHAKDEDVIHMHAKISGFPATRIVEITGELTPASAAPEKKSSKSVA